MYTELTSHIFGNVQCPILANPQMLLQLPVFWYGRKADWIGIWKLSNMADNAGITQSQARDTSIGIVECRN